MFNIYINGELIETIMYEDYGDAYNYALQEYYTDGFIEVRRIN